MFKFIRLAVLSMTVTCAFARPSDVPFIRPPHIVVRPGQAYTMSGNLGKTLNPILIPIARPLGAAVRPGPISAELPVLEKIREPYFYVEVPGEGPGGVTPMPPYPTLPLRSVTLRNGKSTIDLLALAKLVGNSTTVTLKGTYEAVSELAGGAGGYRVTRHYLNVDTIQIRGKAVPADLPLSASRLQSLAISALPFAFELGSGTVVVQPDLTVHVVIPAFDGRVLVYVYDALTGTVTQKS
jgi:hypothetical protein